MAEDGGTSRLSDRETGELLVRLEDLIGQLEQLPGPGTDIALDAIAGLSVLYGEALARIMTRVSGLPDLAEALSADEVVGHLLVLHGVSPTPIEQRIDDALEQVRPYVSSHGGEVSLAAIVDGVARVRLSGSCTGCSSSAATLELTVKQALLAAAPELTDVQAEPAAKAAPAVIPVDALLRRHEVPA